MLNNIHQFLSPRQLGISLAGIGILLTLGFVGSRVKLAPVSDASLSARIQTRSESSLLSKLRRVKDQRGQVSALAPARENTDRFEQKNRKTLPTTTVLATATQESVGQTRVLPKGHFPTKDGIYFYGQSPKPSQIGQGYVIFQKQQGKVKGALYMPQSELSCFNGTLEQSGELVMTVNSSPGEVSPNQVAATNRLPSIGEDESIPYAYSLALQDYHRLNSIPASDRRMLQMCK